MRDITIPNGESIEQHLRADESVLSGGSLLGYTNYLLFSDEDLAGDKEGKLHCRRMKRRKKIRDRLAFFESTP